MNKYFKLVIALLMIVGAVFLFMDREYGWGFMLIFLTIIPVLLFFVINYIVGRLVGKFLKFSYEDSVSLNMTIIARNSPVSLAIAVTAFPDQPLIALALVIGPLIELPVLAIVSQILLFTREKVKK